MITVTSKHILPGTVPIRSGSDLESGHESAELPESDEDEVVGDCRHLADDLRTVPQFAVLVFPIVARHFDD